MTSRSMIRLSVGTFLVLFACGIVRPPSSAVAQSAASNAPSNATPNAAPHEVDFAREIKPILSNNCFYCHGPDPGQRKGGTDGLRLDTPDGALADLGAARPRSCRAIPKRASWSRGSLRPDPDEVMPPADHGQETVGPRDRIADRLDPTRGQVRRPLVVPEAGRGRSFPPVQRPGWPRNPIDRFHSGRLEREGLKPSPEADRYALIRRVSLDLTGLPPTLEEVDAFVARPAIRRLMRSWSTGCLAKPAYGEHWAQLWLDLARYADSAGYADDPPRTIWLFRDYVIRSLNANKPFDQFTIEQIAGDLLPDPTEEQLIATAFHRNTLTNNEGGTNDEEFRNVAVVDRVNTTMAVWMGTTDGLRPVPQPQVRPDLAGGILPLLRLLQQHAKTPTGRTKRPSCSVYTDEQQRQRTELAAGTGQLDRIKLKQASTPELQSAQQQWDAAFPRDLAWQNAEAATAVKADSGKAIILSTTARCSVADGAANDKYSIELALPAGTIKALRLEALPDDALPGKGPGHAGGNFVLVADHRHDCRRRKESGSAADTCGSSCRARSKILHLAEVQVFRGADNVAQQRRRDAKQHRLTTARPSWPSMATPTAVTTRPSPRSHTATSDDPWWEVDLLAEQPLDRIVVWNRTDGGAGSPAEELARRLAQRTSRAGLAANRRAGPQP